MTGLGRESVLVAPAKLTVRLEVVGRRTDGYHDIDAEMVALDLFDTVAVRPGGEGVEIIPFPDARAESLSGGADNLVSRALAATGRRAAVRVEKRIPVGGGLGGGSADAAAILRWAGMVDLALAASLGGDVPFCTVGGRAQVTGIGEQVRPLPYVPRAYVLLVPPFGVDTAAVYRRWDDLAAEGIRAGRTDGPNELTRAALDVEPRLLAWRDRFGEATGRSPVLAGSGSTWFVEGSPAELGLEHDGVLDLGRERGRLISVRTVPAGWLGPSGNRAPATPPRTEGPAET
jgi:4-diphosphocytidyl-2-C-methyl-D-erythritol kinase